MEVASCLFVSMALTLTLALLLFCLQAVTLRLEWINASTTRAVLP